MKDDFMNNQHDYKLVDTILVEDEEYLLQSLISSVFKNHKVATYTNPYEFLGEVMKYSKNTKIFLDNTYKGYRLNGIEVSQILYNEGYTKLFLLSGSVFVQNDLPEYLTAIQKFDLGLLEYYASI